MAKTASLNRNCRPVGSIYSGQWRQCEWAFSKVSKRGSDWGSAGALRPRDQSVVRTRPTRRRPLFFGAVSIWETGNFALNGIPITDWPPVFSLILAPLLGLAGNLVIAAKLAVLASVGAGLWMVIGHAKLRGEEFPHFLALIVGLLPISLICGAGVLSEGPSGSLVGREGNGHV